MFRRLMRLLGYVPDWDYDHIASWADVVYVQNGVLRERLEALRKYAHVRTIEANIENGRARKVKA